MQGYSRDTNHWMRGFGIAFRVDPTNITAIQQALIRASMMTIIEFTANETGFKVARKPARRNLHGHHPRFAAVCPRAYESWRERKGRESFWQ